MASAFASVLQALENIYKASILATPSFSLRGISLTIHSLSDIYLYIPNDSYIYYNFVHSFIRETATSFWITLFIDIILSLIFLYPYLSRLSFGFPTNIYRTQISPSKSLIYIGLTSIVLALPVTIWPIASFILITISYIEVESVGKYVYDVFILWFVLTFTPFISSTIYVTTYRFDLSLLLSLGLGILFYTIFSSIRSYILFIEIATAFFLVIILSKQRWSSTRV